MEAKNWFHLNDDKFKKLIRAKEQLHQAIQLVGMVGRSFSPPDPSDMQATAVWLSQSKSLGGNIVAGEHPIRLALRIADASLLFLDANEEVIDQFKLDNEYYSDTLKWIHSVLTGEGFDISKFSEVLPYQIPEYDLTEPFSLFPSNTLAELAGYFSNAHGLLVDIQSKFQSSEIICWPHHFDIATLITIKSDPDPEKAKTIGVGLSPGDNYYNEPYFYINTWPHLSKGQIQNETWSSAGKWHTKEWIGAVLPASTIITWESGEQQYAKVKMFLEEGVEKLKNLLT